MERSEPGVVKIVVPVNAIRTEQASDIVNRIAPHFFELFLEKNAKYAKVGNSLGSKGVFPDVNRKVGILKDRLWDGNESPGEPTREVMLDLIGHLFLMIHMMDAEEKQEDEDAWDEISGVRKIVDTHLPEDKFEAAAREAYLSKSAERAGMAARDDGPNYPSYGDGDDDDDYPRKLAIKYPGEVIMPVRFPGLPKEGEVNGVTIEPGSIKAGRMVMDKDGLRFEEYPDSEARTSDHIPGRGGW